jgi:3-methyladenine DNA glycosylase AlkD
MHPDHAKLLAELRQAARPSADGLARTDSYGGSGRLHFNTPVPAQRATAKRWLAANKAADIAGALALVESLLAGQSHEEKTLAAILVGASARLRLAVRPADLCRWLGQVNGWAEVDSFCQNLFSAEQMVDDWPAWRVFLEALSTDADINRRRASLVLLTGPVHYSSDTRFSDLAFANIERLKAEAPILITKAVSWLLRALVDNHRAAVIRYLAEQEASLPKIAVRETRTKLATGTKSGRAAPGKPG